MKTWTDDETQPFNTAWREGTVHEVVDADTVDVLLDLGLDCRGIYARVRVLSSDLAFVDAWETKGTEKVAGLAAKDTVRTLMPVGSRVRVLTKKTKALKSVKEKYGRWAAVIAFPVKTGELTAWHSLGDYVIDYGLGNRSA